MTATLTTPRATALEVVRKVHQIVEHDITHAPRSLQTRLGPSEIGNACDRCLIHMLAGTPTVPEVGAPWLPYVGTAVHEQLELAITRHMLDQLDTGTADVGEWITEGKVTVGEVNGVPITGHSDLFHVPTGTVIDHKIVGTTTLRKLRADCTGISLTYVRQSQLYARGWVAAGFHVSAVAVDFYPRNGLTIAQGRTWTAPYDEQVALDALARATRFDQWIRALGAEQVLAAAPPHTHTEFSCEKYTDGHQAPPETTADTFLGL